MSPGTLQGVNAQHESTSESDELKFPSGYGTEHLVAWGSTGLLVRDKASGTVVKAPIQWDTAWGQNVMVRERQVYERLSERGGHEGLLTYHGVYENGIRLEYAPNRDLASYVKRNDITADQRKAWCVQIVKALAFIHEAGIIHGDLTCVNIMLDNNLNARIADFAGSSIDGNGILAWAPDNHAWPGDGLDVQIDLFAFGSVLYHLGTGKAPFEDAINEGQEIPIETLFREGAYPDTTTLDGLGQIIRNCWSSRYPSCTEICADLLQLSHF